VSDTLIVNVGSGATTGGIVVAPKSNTGSAVGTLNRVQVVDNVIGIKADGSAAAAGGVHLAIHDSNVSKNSGNGNRALRGGGNQTIVIVDGSVIVNNGGSGVLADTSGVVLLGSSVVENNAQGAIASNGGQLFSYQDNIIDNNVGADVSGVQNRVRR